MEQKHNSNKLLKSYKRVLFIAYGASLLALILSIAGVSYGLWTDFIVYFLFAVVINIFKNKRAALIITVLSAIQIVFVLISILAGNSAVIELLISLTVFADFLVFYKIVKPIGSIEKIKKVKGDK